MPAAGPAFPMHVLQNAGQPLLQVGFILHDKLAEQVATRVLQHALVFPDYLVEPVFQLVIAWAKAAPVSTSRARASRRDSLSVMGQGGYPRLHRQL